MEIKICNLCKNSKNICEFSNDKTTRDGKKFRCKSCEKQKDAMEILKIADLVDQDKNDEALKMVQLLDTAVREEIPEKVWGWLEGDDDENW